MNILRWLAAVLLNFIPANKPLGTRLFNAVARHSVGVSVEAVLFRRNKEGAIEVYLTKRKENDAYGGQWHCPGSFFRAGEHLKDVFARLSAEEFFTLIKTWRFVKDDFMPEERYTVLLDRVYLVEIEGTPKNERGDWFNVNSLPPGTVESHATLIIPAAKAAWGM